MLRLALRKELSQNDHARAPDHDDRRALACLERAWLPMSALNDGAVVSDMLDASGGTWRLNSGVPATEIAAWAGHSVEVLMRVYARCVVGMEDVWITRMDATLRRGDGEGAGRR